MNIRDFVDWIPDEHVVSEFKGLFAKGCSLSLSWAGRKWVQIKGYEGEVELDELTRVFLEASPFKNPDMFGIAARVECLYVAERILDLYEDCDKELESSWIKKHVFSFISSDDRFNKLMNKYDFVCSFKLEDFRKHWPNEQHLEVLYKTDRFLADYDMMAEILNGGVGISVPKEII